MRVCQSKCLNSPNFQDYKLWSIRRNYFPQIWPLCPIHSIIDRPNVKAIRFVWGTRTSGWITGGNLDYFKRLFSTQNLQLGRNSAAATHFAKVITQWNVLAYNPHMLNLVGNMSDPFWFPAWTDSQPLSLFQLRKKTRSDNMSRCSKMIRLMRWRRLFT